MLVIGVTGQTGAGKGTVCKMLEKYGLYHIDADKVAHSVYKKGSDVLSALSEAFGEDILNPDGTANRAKIAEKAFSSAENTDVFPADLPFRNKTRSLPTAPAADERKFPL